MGAQAAIWRDELLSQGALSRPLLVVVPPSPFAVPLVIAATALPTWVAVVTSDIAMWPTADVFPDDALFIVPSGMPTHEAAARALRGSVHVMSAPADRCAERVTDPLTPLSGSGVVLFTSGSTGNAKPVFRSMPALISAGWGRIHALGLKSGEGIVAGVTLAHGGGLNRLIEAMCLGGPFGWLDPVDHRAALSMLARPDFSCWSATAHFVDALGRCSLTAPPVVPRACTLATSIPRAVYDRFLQRFGVPIRQIYSSTETGPITIDSGPVDTVDPTTVGTPLPGVEIRCGDDVHAPVAMGETGRIWVRSAWQMSGYGFPPRVERPEEMDGWWPTRDVGAMRSDGRLTLAGRMDDCLRTREGRLVNLANVAAGLCDVSGVRNAIVVPIEASAGASFGAVLECDPGVTVDAVRERLSTLLPPWARPRALTQVEAMPRLPSGKIDRRQCTRLLESEAR